MPSMHTRVNLPYQVQLSRAAEYAPANESIGGVKLTGYTTCGLCWTNGGKETDELVRNVSNLNKHIYLINTLIYNYT